MKSDRRIEGVQVEAVRRALALCFAREDFVTSGDAFEEYRKAPPPRPFPVVGQRQFLTGLLVLEERGELRRVVVSAGRGGRSSVVSRGPKWRRVVASRAATRRGGARREG